MTDIMDDDLNPINAAVVSVELLSEFREVGYADAVLESDEWNRKRGLKRRVVEKHASGNDFWLSSAVEMRAAALKQVVSNDPRHEDGLAELLGEYDLHALLRAACELPLIEVGPRKDVRFDRVALLQRAAEISMETKRR